MSRFVSPHFVGIALVTGSHVSNGYLSGDKVQLIIHLAKMVDVYSISLLKNRKIIIQGDSIRTLLKPSKSRYHAYKNVDALVRTLASQIERTLKFHPIFL